MAAIAVVADGGGGGIKPMAPMAASSMVVAVNCSGIDGVFTTAFHDYTHHPCPHCPCPCPPLSQGSDSGVEGAL
jgi:hypothetical protein